MTFYVIVVISIMADISVIDKVYTDLNLFMKL